MRVRVDSKLCVGHGRCYEIAPEVYTEDERGHCVVLREEVPVSLAKKAWRGAVSCPEHAIETEGGPGES